MTNPKLSLNSLCRPSWLLIAIVCLLPSSCGNSRKPVYPVHGQLLLNGQPVPGALIVFHPQSAESGDGEKPHARTGLDGTFSLGTYEASDGAPAGYYVVTVELWQADPASDQGPTSRFPAKFGNPGSSGLTAKVEGGPADLQPFDLRY